MNFDALDRLIRTLMRKKKTPGLALTVLQNNECIYAKGFGARNLKQHLPMTPDTLIGIGSVTKSFTACAIMKLEEEGKLSIDDSVSKHLPVEPFLSRPGICIKHLLSHCSGIPNMDAGGNSFNYTFDDFSRTFPVAGREQFLAHMADAADYIIFEPGEHFFYNNDLYTCLAYIIEDLSGQSFEDYLHDKILAPLKMQRAVLNQKDFDNDPEQNIMTGYLACEKNGKAQWRESEMAMGGTVLAPGGLYVSMKDMLHYAECLLNEGTFRGQQVLSKQSVAKLFAPQTPTPYGRGDNPQYSLGWCLNGKTTSIPHQVIGHGGGMLTSSSNLVMVPELNLAVMVAENGMTGVCPIITDAVIATLLGNDPEKQLEDLRIQSALEAIEGRYQSPHGMYDLVVSQEKGVLQVMADIDDGRVSFPILPVDLEALEFKPYSLREEVKARLQFLREANSERVAYVTYDRYLYRRV